MNQLTKVFEGNEVRVVGTPEQPLFVLTDVCDVLEIGNSRDVRRRLEDDVVTIDTIVDKLGRKQKVTVIDEDGLYDVILESRKPQAKRFRKWVTSEVLPSIRKTGSYEVPQGVPLAELFQATAQLLVKQTETEVAITELTEKVDERMTLDYGQQLAVERAKKKRAEHIWKELEERPSELYETKRKLYGRFGSDLKRAFAVSSYRDIRQNQFDEAISYVSNWRPALI